MLDGVHVRVTSTGGLPGVLRENNEFDWHAAERIQESGRSGILEAKYFNKKQIKGGHKKQKRKGIRRKKESEVIPRWRSCP